MFLITNKQKKKLDNLAKSKARFMLADTYVKEHGKSSLLKALNTLEDQVSHTGKDLNILTAMIIEHLPLSSTGYRRAKYNVENRYIPLITKRVKEYDKEEKELHKIEKEM